MQVRTHELCPMSFSIPTTKAPSSSVVIHYNVPTLLINLDVHVFALYPFPKGRLRAELQAQWQRVLKAHVHIKPILQSSASPLPTPSPSAVRDPLVLCSKFSLK